MKVVYGHTDSIYVQIDSVEAAEKTIKVIENEVRKSFPNVLGLEHHPVVLEFEKYYSALGVGTVKNRNAGMITWEDGQFLDEPKFTLTGFTAKRVSETQLAKKFQTTLLKMWTNQKGFAEIDFFLREGYKNVVNGRIEMEDMIKRSRLKEERFRLKCPECKSKFNMRNLIEVNHCVKCGTESKKFITETDKRPSIGSGIAGVLYAWEKQDITFDDSYLFLKVVDVGDTYTNPLTKEKRTVEYVAGNILADFNEYSPDYYHYAEQLIKKAKPIYDAMGWEMTNIRTVKGQTTLEEWF
jgi:DNA polymerase elongation subunit (family B)